jgi:hypothetical protein
MPDVMLSPTATMFSDESTKEEETIDMPPSNAFPMPPPS